MKHVASKTLNLRDEPLVKPSSLLTSLPFGQLLDVKGPSTRPGWLVVETVYRGRNWRGHLSGNYVRDSVGDAKEGVLAVAAAEWDRFERGAGKEYTDPYSSFVAEYWRARGYDKTGKDRDWFWSAACISWFFERAGYRGMTFATSHSKYIHEAIIARDGDTSRDFWGYRTNEHQPMIGDLIARRRTNSQYIDFDYAKEHDQFPSHTDMVVAVGDSFVDAIGGNVSNSVTVKRYPTLASGYLAPEDGRIFAVLKNRR